MKNKLSWALSIFVAFIFVQSMFFKFSGSTETVIIFSTIANWMISIGLPAGIAKLFGDFGGYGIGAVELVASILILLPATRLTGAVMSLLVMSGAIFFHLFTPLGVDRIIDHAGSTDGGALFYTACAVWVSSAIVIVMQRYNSTTAKYGDAVQPQLQPVSAS